MDKRYSYLIAGLFFLAALSEASVSIDYVRFVVETPIIDGSKQLGYYMSWGILLLLDVAYWFMMAFLALYFLLGSTLLLSIAVLFIFCTRRNRLQLASHIGLGAFPAGTAAGLGVIYLLRRAFPEPASDESQRH
jgi:hypothetical protein